MAHARQIFILITYALCPALGSRHELSLLSLLETQECKLPVASGFSIGDKVSINRKDSELYGQEHVVICRSDYQASGACNGNRVLISRPVTGQRCMAPEDLHMLESPKRHVLTLSGFAEPKLNARYTEHKELVVGAHSTYWSSLGKHFIFWCEKHDQWMVSKKEYWKEVSVYGWCNNVAIEPIQSKASLLSWIGIKSEPKRDIVAPPLGTGWKEGNVIRAKAGISKLSVSCSSFDGALSRSCGDVDGCTWDVARDRCTAKWDIFGDRGPKYNDIAQGDLGTCYFLAAISSIAFMRPDIIEGMFVDRKLWEGSNPVYRTTWLINGRPTIIAVDDVVPVTPVGEPVFVSYNDGYDFWPVLLEKSWAKIFGNFKGVELGTGPEVFKSITGAPVEVVSNDEDKTSKDEVFAKLQHATKAHFPMYASAARHIHESVGLYARHAYAVLGAQTQNFNGRQVRSVRLYNPLSYDRYTGELTNSTWNSRGMFSIAFEEYFANFRYTAIANVQTGYLVSAKVVSSAAQRTEAKLEFQVSGNDPFAVQLEWPNKRFFQYMKQCKAGTDSNQPCCDIPEPMVSMTVEKKDGTLEPVRAQQASSRLSNVRADLPGGTGAYIVSAVVEFPSGPWLKEVVVNAYAKERIEFLEPEPSLLQTKSAVQSGVRASEECLMLMERIENLDNGDHIRAHGIDQQFPPDMESIARPGKTCGDPAQYLAEPCEKYNIWKRIADIMVDRTG